MEVVLINGFLFDAALGTEITQFMHVFLWFSLHVTFLIACIMVTMHHTQHCDPQIVQIQGNIILKIFLTKQGHLTLTYTLYLKGNERKGELVLTDT